MSTIMIRVCHYRQVVDMLPVSVVLLCNECIVLGVIHINEGWECHALVEPVYGAETRWG
jgi:hypothetical protein